MAKKERSASSSSPEACNTLFSTDKTLSVLPGDTLHLKAVFRISDTGIIEEDTPTVFRLYPNHPNPFNATTSIRYKIPERSEVSLKIFDIMGKKVATLIMEEQEAGKHTLSFHAGGLASGLYLYQLTAGRFRKTKKMILVK